MVGCPRCGKALPEGDVVQCTACGGWARLQEVPQRLCACGATLDLTGPAVRCPSCGRLQAADPDRRLQVVADCPRCRRRIEVPADAEASTCPSCGQGFALRDTL